MKSYSVILNEVGQAVDYVCAGGIIPDIVTHDADFYASLADMPDEAVLADYAADLPELGPSAVTVNTAQEFELVYRALGAVQGFSVDRHQIDYAIGHETDHLLASQRVGYRQIRYGLLIDAPYGYGWRPFNVYAEPVKPVTKLALGSQVAAPSRLSDGDFLRLRSMGYAGHHDVGRVPQTLGYHHCDFHPVLFCALAIE